MKKIVPYLFAFIAIVACSKDDSPETQQPTVITGGEAFKGEVVKIQMPEGTLDSDEYTGTFNGQEVLAIKASSTQLVFSIPTSTPVGIQSLAVPALDLTVNYDVKDVVLPGTPEEVVAGFIADYSSFLEMMQDSPGLSEAQDAIADFNTYYDNANAEEKQQIATTYIANKELFDEILLDDYSNIAGRNITADDILLISKHSYAVIAMTAGSAIMYAGIGKEKIVGAVLVIAGAIKARDYFLNLINKALSTDGLELEGQAGTNDRNVNALPVFYHDAAKTLSFKTKERKLTAADAGRTQAAAVSLFSMYNKYNWCANKINTTLTWINNNVPFVSFNLVPLEQFATTAPLTNKNITADTFSNLTFTVSHPNVALENVSFVSEGQISIKFKIVGTPSSVPVDAMLNYSYADEISSFTGKFPVQVTNQIVCGTVTDIDGNVYDVIPIGNHCWSTKNLNVSHYRNGDPIPEIQDYQEWANATTGAWCYYQNNSANGPVYGKLYNWAAVSDPRGLIPEGYHLPTEEEWSNLNVTAQNEAGNLVSPTGWLNGSAATNETGFSAAPSGARWISTVHPDFTTPGEQAWWWSSTLNEFDDVYTYSIFSGSGSPSGNWNPVEYGHGFAVRFVKD